MVTERRREAGGKAAAWQVHVIPTQIVTFPQKHAIFVPRRCRLTEFFVFRNLTSPNRYRSRTARACTRSCLIFFRWDIRRSTSVALDGTVIAAVSALLRANRSLMRAVTCLEALLIASRLLPTKIIVILHDQAFSRRLSKCGQHRHRLWMPIQQAESGVRYSVHSIWSACCHTPGKQLLPA